MELLGEDDMERSDVVANCRMNRERTLTGSNGYEYDLGFNPLEHLLAITQDDSVRRAVRWLDICCGSGTALIEAAHRVERLGLSDNIQIVGIDLVGMFVAQSPSNCLKLITASIHSWQADPPYDLVTCVHGLHYLGDKLGVITRAVSWLSPTGLFVGNLDLDNIKIVSQNRLFGYRNSASDRRWLRVELRRNELRYDSRKKRIRCDGRRKMNLPCHFLGANDQAGPNYTGQPAIDSLYEFVRLA